MPDSASVSPVDQQIFRLDLPVETVSAYLLICGLTAEAGPPTHRRLLPVWNDTPAALETALAELTRRAIVAADTVGSETTYRLRPAARWRRP